MAIKVLIVDDLPLNLKLLRVSLRAEGLETVEAENGVEALKILEREPVDCVVTDILMPEMDGYRLCQSIRASDRFVGLPIIVYTATYVSETDKKLALNAGADLYLRKPASAEKMCAAIRDVMRRGGVRSKTTPSPSEVLKQYSESLIRKLEEKNSQLQLEQDKFAQMTDAIQEVFWMTSADFAKVLYISPAYEKIWGRTCENLYATPRDWIEGVHPADRAGVVERDVPRMSAGPHETEYRIVRPGGSVRWVRVRSVPIRDEAGACYRVTGTVLDVTEEKLLMAQFQQSQKMEAIGRLAGGVAHDFNNLLTVILGLSELNMLALPPGNEQRADFEEIKNTGERAAQLTHQLLAFSRRQVFEPQTADLNALVVNTERLLGRLIGENIRLSSTLLPALPLVLLDPGQVGQVLINLCVNARDSMPKGGRITIETAHVSLAADLYDERVTVPAGEYALLSVTDTGEGMTDEVKAHLFEPFFTTKPLGKGTGLGLATCYGIIKQSNGYVLVDSVLGEGSTFKIYLPVSAAGEIAKPKAAPGASRAVGRETVLIVEDEDAVRSLLARILRAAGYAIREASDGEDALRVVAEDARKEIGLVLTDVVMPAMNGKLLADALKRTRPDVKVLFASGYSDDILSHQGVLDAGVSFIRKPFTPASLSLKIREVLDSSGPDA